MSEEEEGRRGSEREGARERGRDWNGKQGAKVRGKKEDETEK